MSVPMPDAAAPAVADAIGTQIAWSRLIGLVDEAAIILGKTSFSPIVRESHDYSCVLLSAEGDVVAQENHGLPTFIYSLQQVAKAVLERRPVSEWRPGDMYCTNDPWLASADLHDLHVMAPIFRDGKVIAFAANAAHWPDMGGRQWSSVAREVFEEGLGIPPTPLMREGVFDEGPADLIKANVRLPDQAMGDLHAQVVTNQTMAAALERVLDEGLIADFPSFAADLMNRSEQAMR